MRLKDFKPNTLYVKFKNPNRSMSEFFYIFDVGENYIKYMDLRYQYGGIWCYYLREIFENYTWGSRNIAVSIEAENKHCKDLIKTLFEYKIVRGEDG